MQREMRWEQHSIWPSFRTLWQALRRLPPYLFPSYERKNCSRIEGLLIRDCARGCSNWAQMFPQLSAICMTAKKFFELLYLVLGLQKIVPWVNCPYAPTIPTIQWTTISWFLWIFCPEMPLIFVVIMIHQVIWPSPGTLPGSSPGLVLESGALFFSQNPETSPISV